MVTSNIALAQSSPKLDTGATEQKKERASNPAATPPAAVATSESPRTFRFEPQLATVFPTFIGAGAGVAFREHYELNVLYGVTPQLYHETIAKVAADIAGEPSYEGIVNTAFNNNSVLRSAFQYNFGSVNKGWTSGFAFSLFHADGVAQLKDVAESSNSSGLAALLALLIGAGKDPTVELKSELFIAELNFGYRWPLTKKLSLGANLGVAKVVSAEMQLSTELPNYDSSAQGKKTLRETESDLETVVEKYGITPTLGLGLCYIF